MIYPQRDKIRRTKRTRTYVIILALIVGAVALLATYAPQGLSPAVQTLARPILSAASRIGTGLGRMFESLKPHDALVLENEKLKERLAYLTSVEVERDLYRQERDALTELMGRKPAEVQTVVATILSKPGYSLYDTIIVDAGGDSGISAGKTVFADSSTILGRVASVNGQTSTVLLHSAPGERTNVLVGSSSIEAIAEGKGGGNFEIKLPRNSGAMIGDLVVLATNPGQIIGAVGIINTAPEDSFEQLLFKSPVDVARIKYVLIEK